MKFIFDLKKNFTSEISEQEDKLHMLKLTCNFLFIT